MRKVLVAGATGTLGRAVVCRLKGQGHWVRGLGRSVPRLRGLPLDETFEGDLTDPESLHGCCDGVDAVLSCAGASMQITDLGDRRSFEAVDFVGNRNLLAEAGRAAVGKFVYVSLHAADRLLATEYARAHERFVALLRESGLPSTVVRPTGFFSVFGEVLHMARKGRGVLIGSGEARTNPVHEADVAAICVEALDRQDADIAVGGPEVMSRRRIAELAFEVLGTRPRITSIPPWMFHALVAPARLWNRRLHALMVFGAAVSVVDVVAPMVGRSDLRSYFRELAEKSPA
jgi:uncharacterized protein YbjT (DUF2867 family)